MRRTKDEWSKIVERYKRSGLSICRFSERNGIGAQSLRNWVGKFNSRSTTDGEGFPRFVEIPSTAAKGQVATSPSRGLFIHFPDGTSLEVFPATDRTLLEWVLELLGKPT